MYSKPRKWVGELYPPAPAHGESASENQPNRKLVGTGAAGRDMRQSWTQ